MTFAGIPVEALDFYEDLENDNTKSFWAAHKDVYEQSVRDPMRALADELTTEFGSIRFFRPYRDVRFSHDKSPYKTQQGVSVGGHYVHVSAAGLFVAVGYYQMAPDQVNRFRAAVDDDRRGSALVTVVDDVRAKGYVVGGEALKTRPRGYSHDHPRIELLRHKALVAWQEVGAPQWLHTPSAVQHIATAWREMGPIKAWLDDHVGPSDQPRR
ncbi:DUF2461 domain-containing protein [Jiangella asiatica]|uniref:DUF2461 domain-containing protein n=1 Tax=Jiangella asiatica TaxID=2530372 RepID=A0A4R5DSG2_9ACTN|nr:DUF2461 domain-containing protein [Jiangella asiatica]TDE14055.1 DUF2461 domain-containing protein [Jiangella asiatica]